MGRFYGMLEKFCVIVSLFLSKKGLYMIWFKKIRFTVTLNMRCQLIYQSR